MNILGMRPFALLASLVAVAAALAFLFGSGPSSPSGVEAAGSLTPRISCSDIWQDMDNDGALGSAHEALDDQEAAISMTRLEPTQPASSDYDGTTITYLGPDLVVNDTVDDPDVGPIPGDAIPDVSPATVLCAAATASANGSAELGNAMHALHAPANQYGIRDSAIPADVVRLGTYDATNNEDGGAGGDCGDTFDGDNSTDPGRDSGLHVATGTLVSLDELDTDCYDFPGSSPDTLVSSGCAWSEAATAWQRSDSFTVLTTKSAKGINYGKSVLMLFTDAPTTGLVDTNGDGFGDRAGDPNECADGLAFPSITEAIIREPTTDEPLEAKNVANSIATDPSGTGLLDTADGLADDYDGDGCTDWDELDKNFTGTYPVVVSGPVHGTDPFNPADCDENWDSTIAISVIARHNTAGLNTFGGNGQYFRCIGDMDDPKVGGPRVITLNMSCYADSPVQAVNPNYVTAESGAACAPGNAEDNNGNGFYNDGCPASGPAEAGGDCANNTNDDGDGLINDGCPVSDDTCGPGLGPTFAPVCGDGQSAGVPPGSVVPCGDVLDATPADPLCYLDRPTKPYQDIDPLQYPILAPGTLDKGAFELEIGGCFEGYASPPIGPNLYGQGAFDTRTGAGTFNVTFGITDLADCQNGPPFSSGSNACVLMPDVIPPTPDGAGDCTATIVELKSKKAILSGGGALPDIQHYNSDRDGCTDTQELRTVGLAPNQLTPQKSGGKRDPFNDHDYFNPTGDGLNRTDDIIAVVQQYFNDDVEYDADLLPRGNLFAVPHDWHPLNVDDNQPPYYIDYASKTDRTAVPGASAWNLGPPNGQQRIDDILAAVKSYFHDCVA